MIVRRLIKNKVKLYKTLISPVLAYGGSETWVLSKSEETILGVFERKILRAIFGPTNENGERRIFIYSMEQSPS
jgi:hypothetical protein